MNTHKTVPSITEVHEWEDGKTSPMNHQASRSTKPSTPTVISAGDTVRNSYPPRTYGQIATLTILDLRRTVDHVHLVLQPLRSDGSLAFDSFGHENMPTISGAGPPHEGRIGWRTQDPQSTV